MDGVVSCGMRGWAQKDLPILRHIALNLAGADVYDLDLDVFGSNASADVVADCREVVVLDSGNRTINVASAIMAFMKTYA